MKIGVLIQKVHRANKEKGFWEDSDAVYKKDELLALVISELSEAIEADRKRRVAQRPLFFKAVTLEGVEWETAFVEHIKDSMEDELADAFIRLLDYAGGFSLRPNKIDDSYNEEIYNINHHKLVRFSQSVFFIMKDVMDIRFMPFPGRKLGEALGKLKHLADQIGCDLDWHIDQKLKYNAGRPFKHNKEY